jgi:predicted ATPase/DNA-binding winged helix-turn-helix (wHTH) protein
MNGNIAERRTQSFAFGPYLLLPELQLLLKNGNAVRIGGRALDILTTLVENAGEPLTKAELISRVWPETFVEPTNLKVNMTALRQALEEDLEGPQYIATIVGTGYKFIAPVQRRLSTDPPFQLNTSPRHRDNLPTSALRIIGRTDAIESIKTEVRNGKIVSVVGAGGVGKTTVALAVAENLRKQFRDGVCFVDLSPLRDPGLVPNAIATALGYATYSANVLDGLILFLRKRELLLLIDNCEHLLGGVANSIERILQDAPGVNVMATSREPLRIPSERIYDLEGLRIPPLSRGLTAEDALSFSAVQLFVERVSDSLVSFDLTDADAPAVSETCRRLDGIALAIELAAARVNIFGVNGLLEQLDDCFRLLTGRRAGPERQRTLAATLGWSYGLLCDRDAALLRAISVFTGDFNLEGARAVFARDPIDVESSLRELISKSLVSAHKTGEEHAYRLLDTTRAYAFDRLRDCGEDQPALRRHAEHVCIALEKSAEEWAALPATLWGARYGGFVGDLRAALAWAKLDPRNRALLLRLTEAGSLLWNHFSLMEECRIRVSEAIDELESAGLSGTATEMRLQIALAGATMFTRGLIVSVLTALERTTFIATQLGDPDHLLRSLRLTSSFQMMRGEHETAVETLAAFHAVAAVSDPSAVADGDQHLAVAEYLLGRLRDADERIDRVRRTGFQDYDEDSRFARFLYDGNAEIDNIRSHIKWLIGQPETAMRTCESSIEMALKGGHELTLSNSLAWACAVFFWSGQFSRLEGYVSMLDDLIARHNIITWHPLSAFYRSAMACADGPVTPSDMANIQKAVAGFFEIDHLARIPFYVAFEADALARYGHLSQAREAIQSAIELSNRHMEIWCRPEILRIYGNVLRQEGLEMEAESAYRESLKIATEIGSISWKLRTANALATLLRGKSRMDEARHLLQPIYDEFREGLSTRDLTIARELLTSL